jgi:site-specific DNA recombinase
VPERQRVLRLLVKDVLIGREKITIGTASHSANAPATTPAPDTEGQHCQVRWGRDQPDPFQQLP